ncbi:MAG: nucleoside deaminase [Alphaproteobacteria bacterium]|nr:nucleoside deaminase [Alphaproteobacteria bacterium]
MEQHKLFLEEAVKESALSVQSGSSPFGAVIVKEGKIIAKAHNMVVPNNDPTAHAEVMCIRQACQSLKTFDLTDCIIYTSCEPCPMCLNAIKWANITQIFYAATRDDADSIGFRDRVFYNEDIVTLNHIDLKSAKDVMDKWYNSTTKKTY